jgi:predicted cytidylate kinase
MHAVTVGGPPGSGTSTLCRLLKEELDIEYIYAGEIFRNRARELGLTLAEFSDVCEEDPSHDRKLDEEMVHLAKRGNVLLEGRMIGPLCKKEGISSYRIYMHAEPRVRAERLQERDGGDLEGVIRQMMEREESEAVRYRDIYGMDPRDPSHYDLVLDSTDITPEQEMDIVLDGLKGKGYE